MLVVCPLRARAGEVFDLDASQSFDPDGDALDYAWYTYPEAGTYEDPPAPTGSTEATARFAVPSDAAGTQLHVVLEVTDRSAICPLSSYRRIVIDVTD